MALAAFEKGGTLADVCLRLAAHGDNSSDWLLELTDACLDAKRYTDACFAAEQLVAVVGDQAFTAPQRSGIYAAFKSAASSLRAALHIHRERHERAAPYARTLQLALEDLVARAVAAMRPRECENASANVFFGKVQGDFYRFAADAETIWAGGNESPAFNDHDKASNAAYSNAFDLACAELGASDPLRLGLTLNYSVFLHDTRKRGGQATSLAESSVEMAIEELRAGKCDARDAEESSLILELLQSNLALWAKPAAETKAEELAGVPKPGAPLSAPTTIEEACADAELAQAGARVFDAHRAAIVMANLCVSTGTPLGRNQWEVVSGTHRSVMKYHQDAHATFRNCEGAVRVGLHSGFLLPEAIAVCDATVALMAQLAAEAVSPAVDARVLATQLQADYTRYKAMLVARVERLKVASTAVTTYEAASSLAAALPPTHPARLRVVLNHSVFLHDVLGEQRKAISLARAAFEAGLAGAEDLTDEETDATARVLQSLKHNVEAWLSSTG